jgi:hypothetical protein
MLVHPAPYLLGETESVNIVFTNVVDEGGVLSYEIDCTDDGAYDFSSNNPSFACSYPDTGSYTIRGRISDSFGDFNEYTVSFDVLTAVEGISYLGDLVDSYRADGLLNNGQANALKNKLDNLNGSLESGNLNAALGQIGGIVDQLQDFIDDGVLSPENGSKLLHFAQRLMIAIGVSYS